MAERTGFEPVEGLLAPHRFSKPAHSTTLPSLLTSLLTNHSYFSGQTKKSYFQIDKISFLLEIYE